MNLRLKKEKALAEDRVISEDNFVELVGEKLNILQFSRTLDLFRKFGPRLSWDVTNVLLYAAEQDKAQDVLNILENHFKADLSFQHPDARGLNKRTEIMFHDLCVKTLGLKPS